MNFKISAAALACLLGLSFATDPRMEQGARFEAKGEFEKALGEYRAFLAENPRSSEAYFAAAEVRVKMKDYSGALANYRLAYKFDPSMSVAYEGAAKVYELLGQKSKAKEELAKDPKNNPAAAEEPAAEPFEPKPIVAVAEAEPVEEPKKKAEVPKPEPENEVVKEMPAKAPEKEPADVSNSTNVDAFERGKALYAEGKYKEAAPMWREVLAKKPGHAGAYFYAGLTRFQLGEFDKAEFNLKKGLDYKEEGNDAYYFLALIYKGYGQLDQDQNFLKTYLKKAAPKAKYRADAEARLAALSAPKTDPAVAAAEEPKTVEEAKAVEEEASVAEVEEPVSKKVADTKTKEMAKSNLANANLLLSAGSHEMALQMYKALLETELSPEERYFAMLQMGNIYRELRDFHSAVSRYREVVEQFPDSDWAMEAERALEDAVWLEKHSKDLPKRK